MPELERLNLLSCVDGAALEGYVASYSLMVRAYADLCDNGITLETPRGCVKSPALAAFESGRKGVLDFCKEFGLSPASRTRLHAPGQPEAADPMESLLAAAIDNHPQDMTPGKVTDLRKLMGYTDDDAGSDPQHDA